MCHRKCGENTQGSGSIGEYTDELTDSTVLMHNIISSLPARHRGTMSLVTHPSRVCHTLLCLSKLHSQRPKQRVKVLMHAGWSIDRIIIPTYDEEFYSTVCDYFLTQRNQSMSDSQIIHMQRGRRESKRRESQFKFKIRDTDGVVTGHIQKWDGNGTQPGMGRSQFAERSG